MKTISLIIFVLVSFIFGVGLHALAQNSTEDQAITEIAKKRLYSGGVDEQDLEVQSILIKPQKVFGEEETQEQEPQEEF